MAETKALTHFELKDADRGEVRAIFSTLEVIDADGDVTRPGAFEDGAPVRISAYGHASWMGALPVGKGTISAGEKEAVLEGRFFLDTSGGRDTFGVVKEMGELQEWSYGYDVAKSSEGEFAGAQVRFLEKLVVHEVSPVLLGAGVNTRTLAVKGIKGPIAPHSTATTDEPWDAAAAVANTPAEADALRAIHAWVDSEGDPAAKSSYKFPHHARPGGPANLRASVSGIAVLNGARGGAEIPDSDRAGVYAHLARHLRDGEREPPELRGRIPSFPDEFEYVLGGVAGLVSRAKGWGSGSDPKEGRALSAANRERLSTLLSALGEASSELERLLTESDPEKDADALLREVARYERLRSELQEGALT